MGWRDGCVERPAVAEGADAVTFDWATADQVGQGLDGLRVAIADNLGAREGASGRLVDWVGGHRRAYDAARRTHEGALTVADTAAEVARLRRAWDDAAAAQIRANAACTDSEC